MNDETAAVPEAEAAGKESQDLSHIFRAETFVTHADRRIDTASRLDRVTLGNEKIEADSVVTHVRGHLSQRYGERDREAGSYKRTTDNEETVQVASRFRERAHDGYRIRAKFSAEAMVGGAYTQTITGAYLRIAGWIDFMAWIGWSEVDAIKIELAAMMVRSHIGYAHAQGVRMCVASRIVDDYTNRTEKIVLLSESGATYKSVGAPGGGVVNEL